MKRVQLRGHIKLTGDTSPEAIRSHRVRMIVYCDKQCNGAMANVNDILQDSKSIADGTPTAKAVTINNYRNMEFIDRFRVLHDKTVVLNRMAVQDTLGAEVTKQFNIGKNMNLDISFNGVTGAIGEVQTNNIGVMFITDKNSTDTSVWSSTYEWRVRYTD